MTHQPAPGRPLDCLAKICGVTNPDSVAAVARHGASHIGFNFVPVSPRFITPADAAPLVRQARALGLVSVAVVTDPDQDLIQAVTEMAGVDMVQLHGAETPEQARALQARGVRLIKALGVADAGDLAQVVDFASACEMLLLDAKAPGGASMTGGHGAAFDWAILDGFQAPLPWFLAGGLTPQTVAEAVRRTAAPGVDVSSGVESSRGVKDTALIAAFLDALRAPQGTRP